MGSQSVKVRELCTSIFVIPGSRVKCGDERLVVALVGIAIGFLVALALRVTSAHLEARSPGCAVGGG